MVFMARLVPLLISLLLAACQTNTQEGVFNKALVSVKTAKGVCYVNGSPFSGTLIETSAKGDTLVVENFVEGRENGEWKKFYSRGVRKEVRHYRRGKKNADYLAWWENGQPQLLYHFKDGEYEGILKEWDENGQLVKESTYVAGYEEGPQKAWYPNGKVRSNYVVLNGRRYGLLGTKNCINVSDSVFAEL
jgi:antitoxin component YwqK of YwqJK toxin-antitoxin module